MSMLRCHACACSIRRNVAPDSTPGCWCNNAPPSPPDPSARAARKHEAQGRRPTACTAHSSAVLRMHTVGFQYPLRLARRPVRRPVDTLVQPERYRRMRASSARNGIAASWRRSLTGSKVPGVLDRSSSLRHATITGTQPSLARNHHRHATITGTQPSLARNHHWHATITGTQPSLARNHHWHATITGTQPSLARNHHWHATITGTQPSPARNHHRHATITGTQPSPARNHHRHATITGTQPSPARNHHRHATITGTQPSPAQGNHHRHKATITGTRQQCPCGRS